MRFSPAQLNGSLALLVLIWLVILLRLFWGGS
jgi:hypothetical protein